jgi:hypothetical protein
VASVTVGVFETAAWPPQRLISSFLFPSLSFSLFKLKFIRVVEEFGAPGSRRTQSVVVKESEL